MKKCRVFYFIFSLPLPFPFPKGKRKPHFCSAGSGDEIPFEAQSQHESGKRLFICIKPLLPLSQKKFLHQGLVGFFDNNLPFLSFLRGEVLGFGLDSIPPPFSIRTGPAIKVAKKQKIASSFATYQRQPSVLFFPLLPFTLWRHRRATNWFSLLLSFV